MGHGSRSVTGEAVMKKLRMSRRVPVRLLVNIESGASMIEGVVREISEGGMLFFCRSEFEVNTEEVFNLKVFDDEPDIELEGELLYRRLEKEGEPAQGFLYGVKFTDTDSAVKENISRIVRFVTVRERYSKSAASVAGNGSSKKK
jgi:c-di-GMP-binding flagellar brake protein YcgR